MIWEGSESGDALLVQRMIDLRGSEDLLEAGDPKPFYSTLAGYNVQVKIYTKYCISQFKQYCIRQYFVRRLESLD
jgi:hypothetical protein